MLVKLSGERYVATEHIAFIDRTRDEMGRYWYDVTTIAGYSRRLSQVQFDELLSAIPTPFDAEAKRKHKAAKSIVFNRIGPKAWAALSDDEQYDLVSAEASHAHHE